MPDIDEDLQKVEALNIDSQEIPSLYKEPLGIIPFFETSCVIPPEGMDNYEGFLHLSYFFRKFYADNTFFVERKPIQSRFINFGNRELIYVIEQGNQRYAMTISQPHLPFGEVKKEYDFLKQFGNKNPETVVTPMYYFSDSELGEELYIAEYITQARCISNHGGVWGRFIPEPEYRFKAYYEEELHQLLPWLIAKLIMLYDDEKHQGIADFNSKEGDFIMDPKFEKTDKSPDFINGLRLITIRNVTNMTLDEYVATIKREFQELPKEGNIINTCSDCPIRAQDIEKGIQIGLELKKAKTQAIYPDEIEF